MSEQVNPNQLATFEEGSALMKDIPPSCGGGVIAMYIPTYDGPFQPPSEGDKKFYHYEFANGMSGVNVGLVLESKKKNPNWLEMLSLEVNAYKPPVEW